MDYPIRKNILFMSLALFTFSYSGLDAVDCLSITNSSDYNTSITGTGCFSGTSGSMTISSSFSVTDSPNVLNSLYTTFNIIGSGTITGSGSGFDLLTLINGTSNPTATIGDNVIYNNGTITLNGTNALQYLDVQIPESLGSGTTVNFTNCNYLPSLLFEGSGTCVADITVSNNDDVASVYVNNSNAVVVLSGNITGSGEFDAFGYGTINLTGFNTYEAKTQIYGNVNLVISGTNSLGSGFIDMDQSSSLTLSGTLTTPGEIYCYSGAGGGYLFINNGATVTLGGDIGDGGPLNQVTILEGATLITNSYAMNAGGINIGESTSDTTGFLTISSDINAPMTVQGSGASTVTVLSGTTSGGITLIGASVFNQSGGSVDRISTNLGTATHTLSSGMLGSATLDGTSILNWSAGTLGGSSAEVILSGSSQLVITGTSATLAGNISGRQTSGSPTGTVLVNEDWTPGYTLGQSEITPQTYPLALVQLADEVTLTLDYSNPPSQGSNIFASNIVLGLTASGATLTVNGDGASIAGDIDGGGSNPATPNGILNINTPMYIVGNIGANVPLEAINYNANTGYLTLSGSSTITVNSVLIGSQSTLVSSGSTLVGNVEVHGLVTGTGTMGGVTVHPEGTIHAGFSPGTIIITGSSTFAGTTEVTISGAQYSEYLVTGSGASLALGGTLVVIQDGASSDYDASGSYPIIEGSNTGQFSSLDLSQALPGFDFTLNYSYLPNSVYLFYSNGNPTSTQISTLSLSGNGYIIANYLNNNASSSTIALFTGLSDSQLQSAMNSVSPSRNSFGSYAATQTLFGMSNLLGSHVGNFRAFQKSSSQEVTFGDDIFEDLTADASDEISIPPQKNGYQNRFSGWITGFGEFAHLSAISQNPSFKFNAGAVLAGLDAYVGESSLVGGSLGYAHTHYYEGWNAGHGNTNSYAGSVYGNAYIWNFYLTPAIWGVFNQTDNTRNISFPGFAAKARAEIFSWQMIPHLELGYDFSFSWGDIMPFTSADWALSWQRGYTEHGAAPFNTKQKRNNSSMVRSETGLRFSEKWKKSWGAFILKEKASYVFEKPFGTGTVNTSFVGTPSGFTVTAVNQNLNLGAIGMNFLVSVGEEKPIKVDLGYEGEFGSNFWSNDVSLTLSKSF